MEIEFTTLHTTLHTTLLLPFETLLQHGAREMDRMTWFGMVRCVDKTCNFQDFELNAKPLTINTGIVLNSKFVSIDKVTQKHIRASISEVKCSSLKESDLKYKIKYEKFHCILIDEQWEKIFLNIKSWCNFYLQTTYYLR